MAAAIIGFKDYISASSEMRMMIMMRRMIMINMLLCVITGYSK